MAIAKCRLEAWNPVIGGNNTNKWVVAQTPENKNAVVSVYVFDKLANPRNGEVVISNRAKNFASATGTFSYAYKDNEGATVATASTQPLRRGVLTDFFRDFQFIRLVDEFSNQVLFAGRVLNIKEEYDARKGQLLKLKLVDALYELSTHSLKGLCKRIKFYKGSSGQSYTDVAKALVGILYKKERYFLSDMEEVNSTSLYGTTANLVADTVYYPDSITNQYRANIVTDDTGDDKRNRFVTSDIKLASDMTVDITKIKKKGVLGEILNLLQNAPQNSPTINKSFGWDYFVDPNISYGEHADFRGKNLDPDTPPPPHMFNAFERGTRIYETNPAEYGLAIKYPAASNVVTQGHKGSGGTIQYATKPMSVDFDFTRPKEGLYSSALLKYNDAGLSPDSNTKDDGKGKEQEILLEIMYVTEISGAFKYHALTGSGNNQTEEAFDMFDDFELGGGVTSSELLTLHNYDSSQSDNAGSAILAGIARIQYQSDTTLSGATNYGYILLSHVHQLLLNIGMGSNNGKYVLKGAGRGDGTNGSNATCVIDLSSQIANQGYPRRVWGINKQTTISKGAVKSTNALRQEVASKLSRSSLEIVDGSFSISGPPMYHWDGEVKTILNVTGGQQISFQPAGATSSVELWRYGFREGMVIAKMNTGYTRLAQTANGRDIYGYCFGVPLDLSYKVNLIRNDADNANELLAVGDKVRCFIPLRAGDVVRVENVMTDVAGNHLIKEITYTEEPNQMTRFKTTGVNEGFGLDNVGFQAALAGFREESDVIMNVPKGHQIAVWTGLFSAVDTNTVQWQTVGGEAKVILADGTEYNVDCATTNSNHTTDASGVDSGSTRFGLATAPAVGDDTIYYIYLDPNKENVPQEKEGGTTVRKHHFYTRPAGTPETGSDPVYEQDGDNIIIGWMKAGTSGELAEFGVFRDSKPGDGKRNLPTFTHAGSATSALLKKGAQTFSTDLQIVKSEWDNDAAFREVKWHGGEKSDGTQNAVNATIRMADGTSRTILYGGDYQDDGDNVPGATPPEGVYKYTTDGTNFSTPTQLDVNDTYYAYIDFTIDSSGNMTLIWTKNIAVPYGDNRVLLAIVVVPPTVASGRSPIIIPLTTKSLSINAVAIAANSITGDHVQANTIATSHISGVLDGGKVTISADTTFAAPTYNPSSKTQTFVTGSTASPPTSVSAGDLWINPTNNDIYIAAAAGASTIGAGAWVLENDAKTSATAAQNTATTANNAAVAAQLAADGKTTLFRGSTTPTSNEVNDIWIHDDDDTVRMSTVRQSNNIAHWVPRDDANAINNALTSINGGLIKTQRIHLLKGGSAADAIKTTVTAVDDTLRDLNGSINSSVTTVVIDASTTSNTSRDLTGSMTNASTDTTLDVDSQTGSELSILVEDIIKVDNEEMLVTAIVAGTTQYTVTRGWRGTTIASHSSGADVHKYTSKFLMASDVIRVDSEDMYINSSNAAGTSFEVTRAWNGTTAVSHGNNASVLKYNYTIVGMSDPHIIMDYAGISGYSDAFTPEFSLSSEDGKAMFGGGVGYIDASGVHIRQQSGFASRLRFETSGGGALSSIYTHQTGSTDFTKWMTAYTTNPANDGREIHIGSVPDNVYQNQTPQTKLLLFTSQYVGFWPQDRSNSDNAIYYQFPDQIPSNGDVLTVKTQTHPTVSFTGTNRTAYELEWASGGGSGDITAVNTTSPITGGGTSGSVTIAHSSAAGNKHIPSGGSGSSGSRQVLTYNGSSGTATWQNASEHGSHGGGSGTVTEVSVGTGLDVTSATSTPNITLDLSELIDMTSDVVGTSDELILLDNGAERRKRISEITLSDFNNDLGWTSNTGSGTVASGTTGYVAYYTGSTTTGTKVIGGIQYVDTSNIALHANLTMSGYDINFGSGGYINFSHYQSGIKWEDGYGSEVVTLDVPYTVNSTYTFTLPPDAGTSGEVLKTDGSGNTDWIGLPGSSDTVDLTCKDIYVSGNIYDEDDDECKIQLSSSYMQFYVDDAGTSRRVIDIDAYSGSNKGHIGISGYTSSDYGLKLHAAARAYQTYASSVWAYGSDERVKTDITSITGAVDTLKNINPVSFTWTEPYINATGIPDRTYLGFVAQEYEQVFPDDVQESVNDLIQLEDGSYALDEYSPKNDHHDPMPDGATMIMENMKTIAPDAMVPYLVAAVKELAARIEVLEGNE